MTAGQYPQPWVVRDSDGNIVARFGIRPTQRQLRWHVNVWPYTVSFEL